LVRQAVCAPRGRAGAWCRDRQTFGDRGRQGSLRRSRSIHSGPVGRTEGFLDERGRRLFVANEALAHGYGGTATAAATGLARSTINRGIRELRSGRTGIAGRVRRPGGGRKSAVAHQPGLPAALASLIEDAIRGDPCSPLRWVSVASVTWLRRWRHRGSRSVSRW
jgi:hypothetical protein